MISPIACLLLLESCWAVSPQEVVISGYAGYNADSPYNQLYNPRSVVTFKGVVGGIQVAAPMPKMGKAVTLLIKTPNGGTALVDVGPEWYVNNQHTQINIRDQVQVTGSKVLIDRHGVILAEQIVKGKSVLTLRRPNGRPYWDAVSLVPEVSPPEDSDDNLVVGEILRVDTFRDGTFGETQRILVRMVDQDKWVALAPVWFMQRQGFVLTAGDMVRVTTLLTIGNAPTDPNVGNFAATVRLGKKAMVLRTANGRPVWVASDR